MDVERDGLPLAEVIARLNADLAGEEIVSDNPEWERFWLGHLAAAAGVLPTFTVTEVDFEAVLTAAIQQAEVGAPDVLLVKLLQRDVGIRPHRALDDAIGNALRLGQVAVLALHDQQGPEAADQFRQRLVRSAKRLLDLHGRDAFLANTARFVDANDAVLKAGVKDVLDHMNGSGGFLMDGFHDCLANTQGKSQEDDDVD